jgi:sugar/nucleoside kinase (ribokinase family)
VDVDTLFLSSGGGATNAAATFANLGFRVACLARVGHDINGEEIRKDLEALGIATTYLRVIKDGQSAYSTLLTTSGGERTALVFRGVSGSFAAGDIPWTAMKQTRWVYLTSLGGNLALAERIIRTCEKARVHVAWNPGASELHAGAKRIRQLLKKSVDVFNVNREEAVILTEAPENHILKLFEGLHPDSHRTRIITDGENGAYLCNGSSCYQSGTSGVKGVSRTGAGDAFGSGVVACLMQGHGVYTALQVGTLNAESVIQSLGAKKGLLKKFPTAKQLATIPLKTL